MAGAAEADDSEGGPVSVLPPPAAAAPRRAELPPAPGPPDLRRRAAHGGGRGARHRACGAQGAPHSIRIEAAHIPTLPVPSLKKLLARCGTRKFFGKDCPGFATPTFIPA